MRLIFQHAIGTDGADQCCALPSRMHSHQVTFEFDPTQLVSPIHVLGHGPQICIGLHGVGDGFTRQARAEPLCGHVAGSRGGDARDGLGMSAAQRHHAIVGHRRPFWGANARTVGVTAVSETDLGWLRATYARMWRYTFAHPYSAR